MRLDLCPQSAWHVATRKSNLLTKVNLCCFRFSLFRRTFFSSFFWTFFLNSQNCQVNWFLLTIRSRICWPLNHIIINYWFLINRKELDRYISSNIFFLLLVFCNLFSTELCYSWKVILLLKRAFTFKLRILSSRPKVS